MADAPYVVQKVEWFQFRAPDGEAFFVMVSSLPNGYFTAVPCDIPLVRLEHDKMGLADSVEGALQGLEKSLAGKKRDELFPETAG
jgi:hypothetical protein